MSARRRLETAARQYGGSVEWDEVGKMLDVYVDAPHRKLWRESGTHSLSGSVRTYDRAWVDSFVNGLISEMAFGLEDCTVADCDVCEDEGRFAVNGLKEYRVTLVRERSVDGTPRLLFGRASVREVLRREFLVDAASRDEAQRAVLGVVRDEVGRAWVCAAVEIEEVTL